MGGREAQKSANRKEENICKNIHARIDPEETDESTISYLGTCW